MLRIGARSVVIACSRLAAVAALALAGCAIHRPVPERAPLDASGGRAPRGFDPARACGAWTKSVGPGGEAALEHDSFPEVGDRGCFVPVRYGPNGPAADPIPEGCGYPPPGDAARAALLETLRREADRYRAVAEGTSRDPLPAELACKLAGDVRAAAARANARTLSALARRIERGRRFPYSAVGTFGFGHSDHAATKLLDWRPGDACSRDPDHDTNLFGVNVIRAFRAADAHFAGVGAVITVSGGAVHSPMNESFLLDYVLTCRLGVRPDAVLLDPCADHTHTNVRNTGRLVRALGGRTAYVLTDDGLQAGYLQEWTFFDLMGGSIDQRALRDWGYLVGSWRQASVGMKAGFWFTPYRFWAEPDAGLGAFGCVQ